MLHELVFASGADSSSNLRFQYVVSKCLMSIDSRFYFTNMVHSIHVHVGGRQNQHR